MPEAGFELRDLLKLMQTLRDPDIGCPWDAKQDFKSISHCTVEEAYELFDAIQVGDMAHIKEELGDLLFQTVFYAQMADEQGDFDFNDIVDGLTRKLVRRHPHVFPTGDLHQPTQTRLSEEDVKAQWEVIKQEERKNKKQTRQFDDIPAALPALIRAYKIQKRLQNVTSLEDKKAEMIDLLDKLTDPGEEQSPQVLVGELLFEVADFARQLGVDSEAALAVKNQAVVRQESERE